MLPGRLLYSGAGAMDWRGRTQSTHWTSGMDTTIPLTKEAPEWVGRWVGCR